MTTEIPDDQIAELISRGSRNAAEFLYDTFAPNIYQILCAKTQSAEQSEKLLAEIFEFVWQHISKYDHSQQRFALWIMCISLQIISEKTIDPQ